MAEYAMAALADAILRAGGSVEELRAYERDGFHWTNLPPKPKKGEAHELPR